jgi:hypothetical protein
MNRILCSDLTIRFINQELDNISFYKRPDAKFIPPHELTPDQERLKGFDWRSNLRPTLEEVTYQVEKQPDSSIPEDSSTETKLPSDVIINKEGIPKKKRQLLKKTKSRKE